MPSGTRGNSGLGPSHSPPTHPGSLYFPAGLLTLHPSGWTRNSKYPPSGRHFSTRHPGLLTLGILPGMPNWALCYFFLLFLLLSLLCHPAAVCCCCCVSQSDPQRDDVLGQTVTTHEERHSQAESYTRSITVRPSLTPGRPGGPQSPFSHRTLCLLSSTETCGCGRC